MKTQIGPARHSSAESWSGATITEIRPATGAFKMVESQIGPYWPKVADTLAPGCFVHLALPNSFEMDPRQIATQEETEFLEKLETARQLKEVPERNDSGSP